MNTKELYFYSDPGHGWLCVPITDLRDFGLLGDITEYSYIFGDGVAGVVFLEEDCDATIYLNELKKRGIAYRLFDLHTNEDSPIREYSRYSESRARNRLPSLVAVSA